MGHGIHGIWCLQKGSPGLSRDFSTQAQQLYHTIRKGTEKAEYCNTAFAKGFVQLKALTDILNHRQQDMKGYL